MSESMFIRLFAGISEDCFGAIPLVPFGQWLFPVGIFLLVMGFPVSLRNDFKLVEKAFYKMGGVGHIYGDIAAAWRFAL